MKLKTALLALIGLLAAALLVGGAMVMGQEDHANMGTATADLPLKKAGDARPLDAKMVGGVKEFTLTAEPVLWEYESDKAIEVWAYNGQVPGPEIRVQQGDQVRIKLTNNLPKATSLHLHGLDVPNSVDGVPGVTQTAVDPGQSFSYEFTVKNNPGTHFYHTHGSGHGDEAGQMDGGLSGAFIVEPNAGLLNLGLGKPDKEYTMVLDDWQKGEGNANLALEELEMDMGMENMSHNMSNYNLFTLNGLAFPDTKPLDVKAGEKVRVRLINASSSAAHPMHLHGHQFTVMARDGNELTPVQQYQLNTVTLNPGETYDIEFTANNPGIWAFHCHELHHAGSGMVTLIKYEGSAATAPPQSDDGMQMNSATGTMKHNMPGM